MNSAAKSVLNFVAIGLILSGAVVAVFEVSHPFAKYGKVAVYFAYGSTSTTDYQVAQYIATMAPAGTQAPPAEATVLSLVVTIDSVEVHVGTDDETGWKTVSNETVTLDLMKQSGQPVLLGEANIAEQNITMVRMHVTGATATVQDASGPVTVEVPSGMLRINVNAEIRGQLTTTITILPGAAHTVVQGNGEIKVTPVLHVSVKGPE